MVHTWEWYQSCHVAFSKKANKRILGLNEVESDVFTQWRSVIVYESGISFKLKIKNITLQKVMKQNALLMEDEVWLNEVHVGWESSEMSEGF